MTTDICGGHYKSLAFTNKWQLSTFTAFVTLSCIFLTFYHALVKYYSGFRTITPLKVTHLSEIARIVEKRDNSYFWSTQINNN
jgi:hypothetical protein